MATRSCSSLTFSHSSPRCPKYCLLWWKMWRRRCSNRIADHIANCSMDIQRSWCPKSVPPVDNVSVQKANHVIHNDRETRANKCSSAAWCVEA
eukprot:610767-Pyramimonas_sp.AAC.1